MISMNFYDLETYKKDKAVPFCSCIYKLSKSSGKYNGAITVGECQNCISDCVVFKETSCTNEKLYHVLEIKGEPKNIINEVVEYNL